MSQKTYAQAIRDVMVEALRRDPRVFIAGEDVGTLGGIFGLTRELQKEFGPLRIVDTPISESALTGLGIGGASTGLRPIIEFQYMDFTFVAMDQLFNQIAKLHFLSGGEVSLPLVIRTQQGIGRGNGPTHSQSLESFFMHIPGFKVVVPSTPADAAGLLRTALRDNNPVMFIEHKALYVRKGDVPDEEYEIPFGKAKVVREGGDVTIIATLLYLHKALEAAGILERQGIEAEVIDPRTLVPLDVDAMVASVQKTGRAVVVHEAHTTCGAGAEIAAILNEKAFRYLDAPVVRLGAKQCPLPFNRALENAVVPQVQDIVAAVKEAAYR